jgi:hypothetical protein
VVFLTLGMQRGRGGTVGGERQVFVEERLDVGRRFGRVAVAELASFQFRKD